MRPEVLRLVDQGWDLFAEEDYGGALSKFVEAIGSDPNIGDGYSGAGWVYYEIADRGEGVSSDTLDLALEYFDRAVAEGFVDADAQAGRCLTLQIMNEYRQAVHAGLAAIEIDFDFKLSGDPTIDIRDVHLAMAQSYFALGEYEKSLDQVQTIDSRYRTINPSVAGFLAELLSAIENLIMRLSAS